MHAIEALEFDQCRWPLGELTVDFHFCSGIRDGMGSYCTEHSAMAYKPMRYP